MRRLIRKIITLYKNIKFLSNYDLTNVCKNLIETLYYYDANSKIKLPNILTSEESLELILNCNKSLVRFGDGEYTIIDGIGIPCQKYNKFLSKRLYEILKTKNNKLIIGINREYYYPNKYDPSLNDFQLNFSIFRIPYYRNILNKFIDYDMLYCNSSFTTLNASINKKEYYDKFKKIWEGKNLLIVTNKNMLSKITYNIFDNALSIKYIYISSKNAWSEYDYIYNEIIKNNKETLIIAMAGPTAKVLIFDLTLAGYRALDLGHLMKAYDFYKKNIKMTSDNIRKFYMPD